MPRGDGTGPFGKGPMTGRGGGFCGGFAGPGNANAGRGRGRGRGFNGSYSADMRGRSPLGAYPEDIPQYSREDEIRMLKGEAESLRNALREITMRLSELEGKESQ